MKKYLCLTLTLILVEGLLFGQYNQVLRNSSVLEMSKAKLTDDVIINLIMYSPVQFSIEEDSLALLKKEGVSEVVIEAMEGAENLSRIYRIEYTKADTSDLLKVESLRPEIYNTEAREYIPSQISEQDIIVTLNYVTPLADLIKFGENEFLTFEREISEWDQKVRIQTGEVYRTKDQMLQTEQELRNLRNSGIDLFGPDIFQNMAILQVYRGNYRFSREALEELGQQIQKWLKTEMNDMSDALASNINSVAQIIGSTDCNPASGEQPSEITISYRRVNESTSDYLVYLTEIMVWYQNWMKELDSLSTDWNPHIKNIVNEDDLLEAQIIPIENRISQLQLNSRQNRKVLSSLKKQVSEIEKARRELQKKMEVDKKNLTALLKEISKTHQTSLKQRFAEIIENIGYTFSERLSL